MLSIDARHDLAGSFARRASGRVSSVRAADRLAHHTGNRDTHLPQPRRHARVLRGQANVQELHERYCKDSVSLRQAPSAHGGVRRRSALVRVSVPVGECSRARGGQACRSEVQRGGGRPLQSSARYCISVEMAGSTGFEPATSGLTVQCANQAAPRARESRRYHAVSARSNLAQRDEISAED